MQPKYITIEFIISRMNSIGLKQKDLCKDLDINKSSISRLLSGVVPLTKWHKATFYYYLKSFK